MKKYLSNLFKDHHNFFAIDTIIYISIFISVVLLDYYSTMQLILIGGNELNVLMEPFVEDPFMSGLFKITEIFIIIFMVKLMYDILQDKFHTKYNRLCIYISFIIPSIITLIIATRNLYMIHFVIRGGI